MTRVRAHMSLAMVALLLLGGCDNEVRASEKTEEAGKAASASDPSDPAPTKAPGAAADTAQDDDPTAPKGPRELEALNADEFAFETIDPGGRPDEVLGAERDIMGRIAQRSRALDEREMSLATRSKAAQSLEDELTARLDRIASLEKRLQDQVGVGEVARQRRNERITALADLVASMTPQAGSDMVASLSDEDAQWILLTIARKSQRKAAKLMALMPTERAAQLSQLYLDLDPKAVPKGDVLSPIDGAAAPDGAASPPSARTDAQRPAPEEAQAP